MTYNNDQISLLEILEARKAETEAWVAEDPENRFAGYLTTDLDHWAEMGVTSPADLERYELSAYISDVGKDLYGFRPRMNYSAMSTEELRAEADYISDAMTREMLREEEYEASLKEEMEKEISAAMAAGAKDRETAIRWMEQNV